LIRFQNGAGVQVESFWASHQSGEVQIELFGTEAGAKLEPLTIYRTVDGVEQDAAVKLAGERRDGWDNIADHFISCILDGTKCRAPLRHGLQVQIMMEAMLRSGAEGKEVPIDEW
jgi:predicted dehydrogenase